MAIKIPAYQADAFCDRPILVDIKHAVEQIGNGNVQPPIVVQAERGSGKTWLSLHLHRVILKELESHPNSLLLCLQAPQELQAEKNEWFLSQEDALKLTRAEEGAITATANEVLEVGLGKLAKDLTVWRGQKPSIGELSAWILNKIQLSNEAWVVLVDSAYESNWRLLEALERRLLGDLATMTNVLIFITGRGKPYQWQSPYLRTQARALPLSQLGTVETKQQIQYYDEIKQNLGITIVSKERWEQIMEQSQGHPLANILLAQGANVDEVIDKLLVGVSETDRPIIRDYLAALCPLDQFVEDHMATMLDAYFDKGNYRNMGRLELRRAVLDRLIQTNLVRWSNKGYEIEENLRHYLRLAFKDNPVRQAIWYRLCSDAADLYRCWAEQFPKNSAEAHHYREQATRFAELIPGR